MRIGKKAMCLAVIQLFIRSNPLEERVSPRTLVAGLRGNKGESVTGYPKLPRK